MRATLNIALVALMASSTALVQAEHHDVVLVEHGAELQQQQAFSVDQFAYTLEASPATELAMVANCCDQGYGVKSLSAPITPAQATSSFAPGCCDQGYEVRNTSPPMALSLGVLALVLGASLYNRSTTQRLTT